MQPEPDPTMPAGDTAAHSRAWASAASRLQGTITGNSGVQATGTRPRTGLTGERQRIEGKHYKAISIRKTFCAKQSL